MAINQLYTIPWKIALEGDDREPMDGSDVAVITEDRIPISSRKGLYGVVFENINKELAQYLVKLHNDKLSTIW